MPSSTRRAAASAATCFSRSVSVVMSWIRAHQLFVLHEHHLPRHHFDMRLEEDGALRSWAVPTGMPIDPAHDRLAVPVDDHELTHVTYEDATKRIADKGWWELEDRDERRTVFILHGREGSRRYALVSTG